MRKQITGLLVAALFFWCFSQAILYGCPADAGKNLCIVDLDVKISEEEAVLIQKNARERAEESIPFAVWGEQKKVEVSNPVLRRKTEASQLTVSGNSDLVLRGSSWLDHKDSAGCLIDGELCILLFGSTDVSGNKVIIGEREYEVRGVLHGSRKTVLVEADETGDSFLGRMSVVIPDDKTPKEVIQGLSSQYGLTGESIGLDNYRRMGTAAAGLLPCVLGIHIALPLWRGVRRERRRPVRCLMYAAGLVICLLVFLWITGVRFEMPEDWIPSRWSDFEFFTGRWEEKSKELALIFSGEKSAPEAVLAAGALNALKFGLLSVFFFFWWRRRVKITEERQAFAWSMFFICLTFAMRLCMEGADISAAGGRMLWLLLPCFVWGSLLVNLRGPAGFS